MANKSAGSTLAQLLVPGAVAVPLQASSKEGALEELCNLLAFTGLVRDASAALSAVHTREKIASTGCGMGVALPHARLQGLEKAVLAVGLSKIGIDFGSVDGRPVHIFFLIVGPHNNPEAYLRLLSQVAQLLKEHEFRHALLACENARSVIELLRDF